MSKTFTGADRDLSVEDFKIGMKIYQEMMEAAKMEDGDQFLLDIIDKKLDSIIELIKSELPKYESEPEWRILRALKKYFKK